MRSVNRVYGKFGWYVGPAFLHQPMDFFEPAVLTGKHDMQIPERWFEPHGSHYMSRGAKVRYRSTGNLVFVQRLDFGVLDLEVINVSGTVQESQNPSGYFFGPD